MGEYNLVYSKSFQQSLSNLIDELGNEFALSTANIKRFVEAIQKAMELTKTFPKMYEEVSKLYGMDTPTYRIVIGKSYALFYRINHEKKRDIYRTYFPV